MTAKQALDRVWAVGGTATDPGTVKYSTGWIAEIPSFQNFNYVLQSSTKNILALAEANAWGWDALINYTPGAFVIRTGKRYHCVVANLNQDPATDTLRNYWVLAPTYGTLPATGDKNKGLHLNVVDTSALAVWGQSSSTITAERPTIALNTTGASDNLLLANISGFLACVNVGSVLAPDNRSVNIGDSGVHKIFHEGNLQPLTDSVVTTSSVVAASATAVKSVQDLLNTSAWASFSALAAPLSGGQFTAHTSASNFVSGAGMQLQWGNKDIATEGFFGVISVSFTEPFLEEPQLIICMPNKGGAAGDGTYTNPTHFVIRSRSSTGFTASCHDATGALSTSSGMYFLALGKSVP